MAWAKGARGVLAVGMVLTLVVQFTQLCVMGSLRSCIFPPFSRLRHGP